jgi:hypothetical protein
MALANEAKSHLVGHSSAESLHLGIAEMVSELRDILGDKLVTYIARTSDTGFVRVWAEGDQMPDTDAIQRLRIAHKAAILISQREGKATVQSWFQGMNPRFEDKAPAHVLRDEPILVVGVQVISAARALLAAGDGKRSDGSGGLTVRWVRERVAGYLCGSQFRVGSRPTSC